MIEARDSIFENNIASHGGAIYATAGTGITNSTFMYNVATRSGGAVYIFTGQPVPYAYGMQFVRVSINLQLCILGWRATQLVTWEALFFRGDGKILPLKSNMKIW